MKLSAEYWSQSSWEVTLSSKFVVAVHSISEPIAERRTLIYVLNDHPSKLVRTLMMKFLKQSVGRKLVNKSLLTLDVNNTDNRLKHDREMEIGESTSKTLKMLRQEQKKEP